MHAPADDCEHPVEWRHVWRGLAYGALALFLAAVAGYAYPRARFAPTGSPLAWAWAPIGMVRSLLVTGGLLAIVATVTLGVGLVAARRRSRTWPHRVTALAACALCALAPCVILLVEDFPLEPALGRSMAAAEPVISALAAYRADHGECPAKLADLVPTYLESIPKTELANYPDFDYAPSPGIAAAPVQPAYELSIHCSVVLGWDVFVYWPEGNYPDYMHGGSVERIGRWAYVHE